MPICQICHAREASLFFTRVVSGEKTELQVCRQCAAENGGIKIDVGNLLAGLSKLGMDNFGQTKEELVCAHCGLTLEEFNTTGLMGCSNCYTAFSDHVEALLRKAHGNVHHIGKRPLHGAANMDPGHEQSIAETIDKLRMELRAAVMEEAYERAAQLRDRIKVLEEDQEVRT
jgi:protein arginine kinase activator